MLAICEKYSENNCYDKVLKIGRVNFDLLTFEIV